MLGWALLLLWMVPECGAQGEPRLIDLEPYDQLIVKGQDRVFKLVPIAMAKRVPLRDQDPESVLVVQLSDRPQQKYQVPWKWIDRVELYEELVLGEAVKLVAEQKYDEAQQYFRCVQTRSPDFPGLAAARQQCLLSEAQYLLERNRADRAWLALMELHRQNADCAGLREAMGSAIDRLVEDHFASGQDAAARELVEELAARYADHAVVTARREQLVGRAEASVQAARAAVERQQWREAHDAVRTALAVWPDLADARRLAGELNQSYPIARVGVRNLGDRADVAGLVDSWATLRQRRLTDVAPVSERSDPPDPDPVGPYRLDPAGGGEERFQLQPPYVALEPQPPREIVETKCDSTVDALHALDQRRMLVFDRVAPWELSKARAHAHVKLVQYASPTVHLLVPNPRSALLTSPLVRRAINLAIDRERIVRDVLGDSTAPTGQVLSGPFPRGYAYDEEVASAERSPRTAIALFQSDRLAAGGDTPAPSITLAHVRSDIARRAAMAIQDDLRLDGLGIAVTVREIAPGEDLSSASSWDLLYVEWPAMEPVRDAWKLLGNTRWGRAADPVLDAALEQLSRAEGREQAAAPLHVLHRRVHEQLAIIPLWQIDEYALVHESLQGVGERPVTLYQHVEQWQVKVEP